MKNREDSSPPPPPPVWANESKRLNLLELADNWFAAPDRAGEETEKEYQPVDFKGNSVRDATVGEVVMTVDRKSKILVGDDHVVMLDDNIRKEMSLLERERDY